MHQTSVEQKNFICARFVFAQWLQLQVWWRIDHYNSSGAQEIAYKRSAYAYDRLHAFSPRSGSSILVALGRHYSVVPIAQNQNHRKDTTILLNVQQNHGALEMLTISWTKDRPRETRTWQSTGSSLFPGYSRRVGRLTDALRFAAIIQRLISSATCIRR